MFCVISHFLWEPRRHSLPKAASEVACEAFVLGSREISASVVPNKACIHLELNIRSYDIPFSYIMFLKSGAGGWDWSIFAI